MIIPAGCEAKGEWKSKTTVTSARGGRYTSFKIRPKTLSRHGIQYVNDLIGDAEDEVLTVGKMGKTRTRGHKMCKSAG